MIVPTPDFNGHWVIEVAEGAGVRIERVEIDGRYAVAKVVSGIRANGSTTTLTIINCTMRNLPFNGIDISGGAGALSHHAPVIDRNQVTNVGWVGINIEAATDARISNNRIASTGYHGISATLGCRSTLIAGNHVRKASPPTRIFDGDGSLQGREGGFMIAFDQTADDTVIDQNICEDNVRAGYDGIGVAEDGTPFGRSVISRNIVRKAGLFGIDAPGNCLVENNMVEDSIQQGIHIGLDLGGTIENVIVRGNAIKNTGTADRGSIRTFGILIGDTHGRRVTMRNIRIASNRILDDRNPQHTGYGIGVVSDEATYSGLEIVDNDLTEVRLASFVWIGSDGGGPDFMASRNQCLASCAPPPAKRPSAHMNASAAAPRF